MSSNSQPRSTAPLVQRNVSWGVVESLLALVFAIVGTVAAAPVFLAFPGDYVKRNQLLFDIVGYQFLVAGIAVAAVFVIIRHQASVVDLGFRRPGWQKLFNSFLALPVLLVGVVIVEFIFNSFFPSYQLHGNTEELGNPHGAGLRLLVLVWACVQAPLAEEVLFRGIVYQGFLNSFGKLCSPPMAIGAAALVSGIIFGAVHFQIHTFPILVVVGIVLALVFQYTRSVFASGTIHGAINFIAVLHTFHYL